MVKNTSYSKNFWMRTLLVVSGVGGNPSGNKNDLEIMSALKNGKICVDLIASGKKNQSI